ncbi:hypothetical protein GCM10009789_12920 [Kribbella sancticallisti]|uniref:Uncharacterized protein n=1 Tax=Kribbella sancticallisti TaxID=460087 RepID=A0ABP4NIP2_9ACTN
MSAAFNAYSARVSTTAFTAEPAAIRASIPSVTSRDDTRPARIPAAISPALLNSISVMAKV